MSKLILWVGAIFVVASCGEDREAPHVGTRSAAVAAAASTLNTFIADYLEIDQATPGGLDPADANLWVSPTLDPADGSPNYQQPPGPVGATWVDWNELGADIDNHRLQDLNAADGKDPTSFPKSNECVNSSKVLTKMDLTYVAAASNTEYAYFGVQRAGDNGDAGYYWLFNKVSPLLTADEAPCSGGDERLTYDISVGDVLLAGHFHPNGTPLLRIFHAIAPASHVPATAAIDYTNAAIWAEQASAVAAVAVNTTITDPGSFGSDGVKNLVTGNNGTALDTEIFAEAAIDLDIFTGGAGSCGAQFYGSVITRSSGAGGTSPDLKDLAGPAKFNFGSTSAQAKLTPSCTQSVHYKATATNALGQPVTNPSCTWTCGNGVTLSGCEGDATFPIGTTSCDVTVTDQDSTCTSEPASASATVYADVTASATLSAGCTAPVAVGYSGTAGGGSGGLTYAWLFSDGGTSTSLSGSFAAVADQTYSGTLTVTDDRGCKAVAPSNSVVPRAPVAVSIAPSATGLVCPMDSTAVTYSSTISGGTGSYSLAWLNHPECAGMTTCTIHPADSDLCYSESTKLTVTDADPDCAVAASELETYKKTTSVVASNN